MKKIKIELSSGTEFEIEATDTFFEAVATHFNLKSIEDVSKQHLTEFIYSVTKNALEKAEKDPKNNVDDASQIKLV
jgi:hypothetical protein